MKIMRKAITMALIIAQSCNPIEKDKTQTLSKEEAAGENKVYFNSDLEIISSENQLFLRLNNYSDNQKTVTYFVKNGFLLQKSSNGSFSMLLSKKIDWIYSVNNYCHKAIPYLDYYFSGSELHEIQSNIDYRLRGGESAVYSDSLLDLKKVDQIIESRFVVILGKYQIRGREFDYVYEVNSVISPSRNYDFLISSYLLLEWKCAVKKNTRKSNNSETRLKVVGKLVYVSEDDNSIGAFNFHGFKLIVDSIL
jgi:hypothetical protein